jgi:uncharacterized protein YbjQ (UPF0145 family)
VTQIPILTTPIVEGATIVEYKGIVTARNVRAVNIIRDFFTSFRDIVGGRSGSYQEIMDQIEQEVFEEIRQDTVTMGGNAVIGFTFDIESIGSKDKSLIMAHGRGTAVVLKFHNAQ